MPGFTGIGQDNEQLTALLLTLADRELLVPNIAVAELVGRLFKVDTECTGPMLGTIEWRGMQLPLLSFERLSGTQEEVLEDSRVRLVVLKATVPVQGQHFYALVIRKIPRTWVVNAELQRDAQASLQPFELDAVSLDGRSFKIPDLQAVEGWLASQPVVD